MTDSNPFDESLEREFNKCVEREMIDSNFIDELVADIEGKIAVRESSANLRTLISPALRAFNGGNIQAYNDILDQIKQKRGV